MSKKPCDHKTFELLVLAALKHEEISEGRARELLGWKRETIREEQDKRVGKLDYATQDEVWAEEGGIRLRLTERNSQLVAEVVDTTSGWPGKVVAVATITDWRVYRLMAVMRQVVIGYLERHFEATEPAEGKS